MYLDLCVNLRVVHMIYWFIPRFDAKKSRLYVDMNHTKVYNLISTGCRLTKFQRHVVNSSYFFLSVTVHSVQKIAYSRLYVAMSSEIGSLGPMLYGRKPPHMKNPNFGCSFSFLTLAIVRLSDFQERKHAQGLQMAGYKIIIRIPLKSEASELELVSVQLYREKNSFVCLSVCLSVCFCVCLPVGRVAWF